MTTTPYTIVSYRDTNECTDTYSVKHVDWDHTFKDWRAQKLLEDVRECTRTNWQVAVFTQTVNDKAEQRYMLYVPNRKGQHVRVVSFYRKRIQDHDQWRVSLDLIMSFLKGKQFNHLRQLERRYTQTEWVALKKNRLRLEDALEKPQFSCKFEIRSKVDQYDPYMFVAVKGGYNALWSSAQYLESDKYAQDDPEIMELLFLANKQTDCEWKTFERPQTKQRNGISCEIGRCQISFYHEVKEEEEVIEFYNAQVQCHDTISTSVDCVAAFLAGILDA